MSRSGYDEDGELDNWALIKWRGRVASAIRGRRGQALLRETLAALEAMPEKRLIAHELEVKEGPSCGVCTLGAVGVARGVDLARFDPDDDSHREALGNALDVAMPLIAEIEWENDENGPYKGETEEQRWARMHTWVKSRIKADPNAQD